MDHTYNSFKKNLEFNYELRYAKDQDLLMDEATWNEAEQIEIEQIILQESQNHPESKMQLLIDRSLFELSTPYFLALKSYDQKTISNIAQFTLDKNGAVSGSDDKIPYNDEDKQAGCSL